jgi:hypothetical protein
MMTSGLPLRLLVPLYQLHLCAKKGLCQIGDQRDSWLTICLSKRAENFAYGHNRMQATSESAEIAPFQSSNNCIIRNTQIIDYTAILRQLKEHFGFDR